MGQNFLPCDREQGLLLPPSLREWLPEDHLAWFVLDAVDEIDLSAFYGAYRKDGWGRAAFEPQMMVALLLYAYAIGERSSRGIECRCREDIAFGVITANRIPDHATIARFRARHDQPLADIFSQLLALCARAGLVSVGVVALDGSLLAGNASPGATRSYASIREEVERILGEAAQADAAEDQRLGDARGDELPAELVDARSRRERLRRCKQQLEQAQAEEEAAYRANLEWRAAWKAEHGRRLAGRKPTPPDKAALAARKINTTDPDTRARAADELRAAGVREPIGTVLADGGYGNSPAITEVRGQGIDVLIPTQDRRRATQRRLSPRQGAEARRIEAALSTPEGQALYRRRQQIVEPRRPNASAAPTASCAAASPPAKRSGS